MRHTLSAVLLLGPLALGAPAPAAHAAAEDGDVTASRTILSPAEPLYQHLLDLEHHAALWGPDCASRWVLGTRTVGEQATAKVTYHAGPMNRRRSLTLHEAKTGRRIELDHAGAWGWVTGWTLTEKGGTTHVELTSWIQPPPWPFRKAYFERVQPAWATCHQFAVDALDATVRGGAR